MMAAAVDQGQLIWSPQPGECRFAAAADLYRYWLACRGGRRFPARADLDPLQMRGALGNLTLIEVHRDPLRFRLRLVGTNQTARLGFDPTGLWLDEMPTREYGRLLIGRITLILEHQQPLLVRNRQFMDDRWYDYETLWLPLAADGETIDMLLACQFFADAAEPG
ncbi:PAS domain-containing protein [Ferrovibrio xuzhouensis]|uniref:PAS domain-containing protein n=1 Tax=Ferrovibrio xuzhouensis TaxID=1576914 RepID=A0ABV7VFT4_9PROT